MVELLEQRLPIFVYHVSRITEHCIADNCVHSVIYIENGYGAEDRNTLPLYISMETKLVKRLEFYHKSVTFRQRDKTDKERQLCEIRLKT